MLHGGEPYTMAMVLNEYKESHPAFRFRCSRPIFRPRSWPRPVRGSSTTRLCVRCPRNCAANISCAAGIGNPSCAGGPRTAGNGRVPPAEFHGRFRPDGNGDVIFCRNVLIYFDPPTQERMLQKLRRQLVEGGYMFLGHSETLQRMDVPLRAVAPALLQENHDRDRL